MENIQTTNTMNLQATNPIQVHKPSEFDFYFIKFSSEDKAKLCVVDRMAEDAIFVKYAMFDAPKGRLIGGIVAKGWNEMISWRKYK